MKGGRKRKRESKKKEDKEKDIQIMLMYAQFLGFCAGTFCFLRLFLLTSWLRVLSLVKILQQTFISKPRNL